MLRSLEGVQEAFNAQGGSQVSLADLIVLAGAVGVEQAAEAAGVSVEVPFTPGRTDATQEQTDVDSFSALEPTVDGFRNYLGKGTHLPAEYHLVDRANLLDLSAPEMTVLVGGLRVLGANAGGSTAGVLTKSPGSLTNDFFVNLLDMGTTWTSTDDDEHHLRGPRRRRHRLDRDAGPTSCSARTPSCARSRRCTPATTRKQKFAQDFVAAWAKVMDLDRYDVT